MSRNKISEASQMEIPVIQDAFESVICEQDLMNEIEVTQYNSWVDENGRLTEAGMKELGCGPSLEPKEISREEINFDENYPELARARKEQEEFQRRLGRAAMADPDLVVLTETETRWNGHTTHPDIES